MTVNQKAALGRRTDSIAHSVATTGSPQTQGLYDATWGTQLEKAVFLHYAAADTIATINTLPVGNYSDTEQFYTVNDVDHQSTGLRHLRPEEATTTNPTMPDTESIGPPTEATLKRFLLIGTQAVHINQQAKINVQVSNNLEKVRAQNFFNCSRFITEIKHHSSDVSARQLEIMHAVANNWHPGFELGSSAMLPDFSMYQSEAPSNLIPVTYKEAQKRPLKWKQVEATRREIQPHAMLNQVLMDFDFDKIYSPTKTAAERAEGANEYWFFTLDAVRQYKEGAYARAHPQEEFICCVPFRALNAIRHTNFSNTVLYNLEEQVKPYLNPLFPVENQLMPSTVVFPELGSNFKFMAFEGDRYLQQTMFTPASSTARKVAWCYIRPKNLLDLYINNPALEDEREPLRDAFMLPEIINEQQGPYAVKQAWIKHAPGAMSHVYQAGNVRNHNVVFESFLNFHLRMKTTHNEAIHLLPINISGKGVIERQIEQQM